MFKCVECDLVILCATSGDDMADLVKIVISVAFCDYSLANLLKNGAAHRYKPIVNLLLIDACIQAQFRHASMLARSISFHQYHWLEVFTFNLSTEINKYLESTIFTIMLYIE